MFLVHGGFLVYLDLWVYRINQIWENFSHCFLKYFLLTLSSFGYSNYTCIVECASDFYQCSLLSLSFKFTVFYSVISNLLLIPSNTFLILYIIIFILGSWICSSLCLPCSCLTFWTYRYSYNNFKKSLSAILCQF